MGAANLVYYQTKLR